MDPWLRTPRVKIFEKKKIIINKQMTQRKGKNRRVVPGFFSRLLLLVGAISVGRGREEAKL